MKRIPTTKGKVAFVDDIDWKYLSKFKWCDSHGYASRKVRRCASGRVYMHWEIARHLGWIKGVDHINGDAYDNRRSNLREASKRENNWNKGLAKNNTSGFKGVCYHVRKHRWVAYISSDRRRYNLGYYRTPEEAAYAYNVFAEMLFGEFARLNKI